MSLDDKLDKVLEKVNKLEIGLARIEERQVADRKTDKDICEQMSCHDERLVALEQRPIKWYNIGIAALISSGVAALIGYFSRN